MRVLENINGANVALILERSPKIQCPHLGGDVREVDSNRLPSPPWRYYQLLMSGLGYRN